MRAARSGSFSRAAKAFGLTQPSASRSIASLEKEIGAALFTRTTRAVSLTEAGAEYLARVEPLLASLDEANHEVRGTGEIRGVLRVGLPSTLAIRRIIPVLPRFAQRHPNLRIACLIDDERQDLVGEGVDVALRLGKIAESTAVARLVAEWPRVLLASPAYLERAGTPTDPSDLSRHDAVLGTRAGGPDWSFRKEGKETTVRMRGKVTVTLNEGAIAAASAGFGIVQALLPSCRSELDAGVLVRVLPDWDMGYLQLHALFAAGRAAKPGARAFAEFLRRELRDG